MLECRAAALTARDEFTTDDGASWHKVKCVRSARQGTKTVVITVENKEFILDADQLVVVKP